MNVHGYFLPVHNEDFLRSVKKVKILIDRDTQDKITRLSENLAGSGAKIPITHHGSDLLLHISVPSVAIYESNGQASSLQELLGQEIDVEIKLQKYSIVSKYERNKGEKISGIKIGLVKMINLNTVS